MLVHSCSACTMKPPPPLRPRPRPRDDKVSYLQREGAIYNVTIHKLLDSFDAFFSYRWASKLVV